jgi:hypothetical protein
MCEYGGYQQTRVAVELPDHVAALGPRRLVDALDLLRVHVLKEQDGVVTAALASLDGEAWARVETVRAQVGSRLAPEAAG